MVSHIKEDQYIDNLRSKLQTKPRYVLYKNKHNAKFPDRFPTSKELTLFLISHIREIIVYDIPFNTAYYIVRQPRKIQDEITKLLDLDFPDLDKQDFARFIYLFVNKSNDIIQSRKVSKELCTLSLEQLQKLLKRPKVSHKSILLYYALVGPNDTPEYSEFDCVSHLEYDQALELSPETVILGNLYLYYKGYDIYLSAAKEINNPLISILENYEDGLEYFTVMNNLKESISKDVTHNIIKDYSGNNVEYLATTVGMVFPSHIKTIGSKVEYFFNGVKHYSTVITRPPGLKSLFRTNLIENIEGAKEEYYNEYRANISMIKREGFIKDIEERVNHYLSQYKDSEILDAFHEIKDWKYRFDLLRTSTELWIIRDIPEIKGPTDWILYMWENGENRNTGIRFFSLEEASKRVHEIVRELYEDLKDELNILPEEKTPTFKNTNDVPDGIEQYFIEISDENIPKDEILLFESSIFLYSVRREIIGVNPDE